MREVNLALALLGGLTLLLSLAAGILRRRALLPTEPMLAVLLGVLVGPYGLDVFTTDATALPLEAFEQLARLTVALAVTSIALRLPEAYVWRRARSLAVLLGPGMVAMWLTSSLLTFALLPLGIPEAMVIGAAITPTDPVLANSIVVGTVAEENIPERLRSLLSAEAGANDGLAYLFVFLPILLVGESPGVALGEWLTRTLLWEVLGAVVIGFAVGAAVGYVERQLRMAGFVEETPVLTISVALAAAVLGGVALAGTDGILAVFVAGLAFNWQADPRDAADEQRVSEVLNRLFTIPVFVVFGMVLPWAEWATLGWPPVALVVGVLVLRRLPMVLALRPAIRPLDRPAAALFVGWFGPIGIAALFYATLVVRQTDLALAWPVVSLVVLGSIVVHGATASLFTLAYGHLDDEADAA